LAAVKKEKAVVVMVSGQRLWWWWSSRQVLPEAITVTKKGGEILFVFSNY